MKYLLAVAIFLTSTNVALAQNKLANSDTIANKKVSKKKNNLLIKFQSANTFGMIKSSRKYYNFKSMVGTGAELLIGFKLYQKTALGFGLQGAKYFLNQSKVDAGLTETYTQPWMSASVKAVKNSSLIQKGFFVYMSGWNQKNRHVLEYYAKMRLQSFQYKLHSVVNRKSSSYHSIITSFDGGISSTGFTTAVGINYAKQISKIFYVGTGLEYNYNFSPNTYLYAKDLYSTGSDGISQIQLPTPSHILQWNIGVMYKPYKPCNCKEQKPW